MSRPTPETDSKSGYPDYNGCWKYNDLGLYVDADFARHLERERDEARSLTEHQWLLKVGSRLFVAGCKSDGIIDSLDEIIRERDELQKALREILKVSEPTPVLTYQKMEDIASKALKDTAK